MSLRTGPHTPDDVVAHLRRHAHDVPPARLDASGVLAAARRALRRRRRRQTVVGVVASGLLGLTVAGPVPLPGVGTLTMPGSHEVRIMLGVEQPDAPALARPGLDQDGVVDHDGLFGLFGVLSSEPSRETMAKEVVRLQAHVVPVLEELHPTSYEVAAACDILEYPRGVFSEDGTCGGRPGERPFDDVARADLDRIIEAIERSGVPTDELMTARYAPDGSVEAVGLVRSGGGIAWNFAYLYSPEEKPPEWESTLGPVTLTRIGETGWWFEESPDD